MDRQSAINTLEKLHKEIITDLKQILAISDPTQSEKSRAKIMALITAIENGLYDTADSLTRMSGQIGDMF